MMFHSPSYGEIDLTTVLVHINTYLRSAPNESHKIIIGSDSSPAVAGRAEFVTALVVHRVGRGGIYFWQKHTSDKMTILRDRMYREALYSLELAHILVKEKVFGFGDTSTNWLEIHVDIGENGPTRPMIKEIVGMVTGSGFTVKTKPASYAASKVADRYT